MSLRSIIVIVLLLASSISRSSGALDVALVINSVPYKPGSGSQLYWQGLDALDNFLRSFAEQILTTIPDSRVAVVSAYIDDPNDEATTGVKVLHAWSDVQTADAIRGSFLYVAKPPPTASKNYETKKLFEDVKSSLFTPEKGDRPDVPNILCLVGLKYFNRLDKFIGSENDHVRFMEEFDGMIGFPIRLIVISFVEAETNHFVGFLSVGRKISMEPVVGNAIETGEKMAEAVRKVIAPCERKLESSECYYDQFGDCVQHQVYTVAYDSDPPNYCRRNVTEVSPCPETTRCDATCDSTIKWSECDCDKDLETKVRDQRKEYKLYQFCASIPHETRKCDNRAKTCPDPPKDPEKAGGDGGTEPLTVLAISLGVVFGILCLGAIGLIVFLLVRRQRRRRRQRLQSPHQQRGNDRRGKKSTDSRNVGGRGSKSSKSRTPSTRPTTTMDRSAPRRPAGGGRGHGAGSARTFTPSSRR